MKPTMPSASPSGDGRSPKSARPTRTSVLPSSMATSKSSLMPIESPAPSARIAPPAARSESARRRANVGRAASGSPISQPDGHEAADLEVRQAEDRGEVALEVGRARSPSLAGSASTLTWR